MFVLALVGVGVLASLLSTSTVDGGKYSFKRLWNRRKRIQKSLTTLEKKLKEVNDNLTRIDDNDVRSTLSDLPFICLEELERCRYEIEDIKTTSHVERVTKLLDKQIENIEQIKKRYTRVNQRQISTPRLIPEVVAEREEEKEKIIAELINEECASPGVSITGIAGIGKTALARAIIRDGEITRCFPLILEPPPSSEFDSKHITEKLPFTGKVLVLLDGIETVDLEHWHDIRVSVIDRYPGSKFIITTQNPHVADITGTARHYLSPLSKNQCLQIILSQAKNTNFSSTDEAVIKNNEKELTDLCKGLPLLASRVGLLLSATPDQSNVIRKLSESLWKVPELGRILLTLKPVSLLREEPQLNRCLAYCTLFPEDHDFEKDDLVQLWMAEGFTKFSSADAESAINGAAKDFDLLHSCSIFHSSGMLCNEQPSYQMQEIAYDLAQYVASTTCCRKYIGNANSTTTSPASSTSSTPFPSEIKKDTRHFSLSSDANFHTNESTVVQLINDIQRVCTGLRTFLLLDEAGRSIGENPTFFHTLTYLRVLSLSHSNLLKLNQKHISELKYLRYLDLSYTPLRKLPNMSKNIKLQVLKLNFCENLLCLHESITNLTNLVSLQVNTARVSGMPPYIGRLSKLQKLDVFKVGVEEGYKIAELKNLNGLRNSLIISQLDKVETEQEAKEAELDKKKWLDKLELQWSSEAKDEVAKQVFKGLKPPKNLKELIIRGYCPEFPEWLNGTKLYGVLKTIHLEDCTNLVKLPPLDHLKTLEKLQISGCTELQQLPKLPSSLKSLVIKDSAILGNGRQVNHPNWPKIEGVKVELDPHPVEVEVVELPMVPAGEAAYEDQRTENGDQSAPIETQTTVTSPSQPLFEESSSLMSSDISASGSWSRRFGLSRLTSIFAEVAR